MKLRHLLRVTLAVVSMGTAGLASVPAVPVKLSKAEAAAAVRHIEQDRTDTEQWLQAAPTSYLATIDRRDFGTRTMLSVGRASDNDVRIDDGAVSAHHLRIAVDGDRFRVEAVDPAARFGVTRDGKIAEVRSAVLDPSAIQLGRLLIRLSHQRFPALIVFDPDSPGFKSYKGLKYYPVDLSYRYELPLTPNPARDITLIMSTRGNQRRAERVGWFDFAVGGIACRLEALRLLEPGVDESELGVFFRDQTTGNETYALGRYVDAKKLPNGRYVLDFNMAYNPACAFSDHYNCPIPPKANVLTVAIRAGERDAHYH
jgi:uncharacterized protein (DUF1684 family)